MPRIPLISVVDDDEALRRSLDNLIRSAGFRARGFSSAEAFLESNQLSETDCLILDLRIPGMSGLELQRQLSAANADVPIIFITAHEDRDQRTQALEAGAVAFLYKPFYEEELLHAIETTLKKCDPKQVGLLARNMRLARRLTMNEHNPFVCVIDDESLVRESLSNLFRSAGLKVQTFGSAQEFLTNRPSEAPSCLVLDVQMPGISGLELQRQLGSGGSRIPIIFMTGYGDIPMSVRAMKAGAFEFLTKPCHDEDLLSAVNQAIERGSLIEQSQNEPAEGRWFPDDELRNETSFSEIVGQSPALREVLRKVELVAPNDATVLVLGETGTGKELIARAIHERSRRRDKPLVRVNCTSIPKELFESEFFGHAKGAFTGAIRDRAGRFEIAAGGTLFLDEVGEIPLELQSKLLRVLQEKSYERVGEEKTRRTDVRIIAATNRDLKSEVAAGRFREDLYYRLNVFPLKVAPLKDRKEDISLLAAHFVELSAKELGWPKSRLTRAGIEMLQNYDWPGNIRELRNIIERAVIFARGGALEFDLLGNESNPTSFERMDVNQPEPEILTEPEVRRRERENLFAVLQKTGWKIKGADGAAELLGIKPSTLISRIAKMGLKRLANSN